MKKQAMNSAAGKPVRPRTFADQGIGHVGLKVSDLRRSQRFYSEVLGLTSETTNPNVAKARCGSDTLILYEERGGDPDFHFGFRLASSSQVDQWKSWIRSNNIPIHDDIVQEDHPRSFKFKDPDGYSIEISSEK